MRDVFIVFCVWINVGLYLVVGKIVGGVGVGIIFECKVRNFVK